METKCPKCGYDRKSTDTAPEWQCPSCGVAYAKALQAKKVVPASSSPAEIKESSQEPSQEEVAAGFSFARAVDWWADLQGWQRIVLGSAILAGAFALIMAGVILVAHLTG